VAQRKSMRDNDHGKSHEIVVEISEESPKAGGFTANEVNPLDKRDRVSPARARPGGRIGPS
jgi:hypothetical protein